MAGVGEDVAGSSSLPPDRVPSLVEPLADAAHPRAAAYPPASETGAQAAPDEGKPKMSRTALLISRVGKLITAIRDGDDSMVESAVLELSRSRRLFAPLALVVGAFAMLFDGLRLLLHNWRLTLVQLLPAMWIWVAMFDLKFHILRGKSFNVLYGPILIPLILGIAAVTAASFFLNAVFAFAVSEPGNPEIRPAFERAKAHLWPVLGWGFFIGIWLGVAALIFSRWGRWWFTISMSIVVGVMMFAYVALPSRLIGLRSTYSRRDKLSATAVGGAIGAVICAPPYALGRIGLLMLGSRVLFIPGILLLALGITLQAGATSAVKAIKMSAKLVAGRDLAPSSTGSGPSTA